MAKDDILTAMVTMRLREDAAAAYKEKSPAERREIMQHLRDQLDKILFESVPSATSASASIPKQESTVQTASSGQMPGSRRRPPVPND